MIGHLFASLVIEYTVFSLITVHMANILTIDHANLISVTRRSERMNARDRWVLKDSAGMNLPAPIKKIIDLEGGVVKDRSA
jgi:hypothetical protein